MAGSAESIETTPATEATVCVAVRGGGIDLNCSLTKAWFLKPEIVACRQFVQIDTYNRRCRRYLEDNFGMVHALQTLRNQKVAELMRALPGPPKSCKRELIDRLPPIITVEVATEDGLCASVDVLPSWRDHAMLKIELTTTNLDLLMEKPQGQWAPEIDQPNVYWLAKSNRVGCMWWDCQRKKWRNKTRIVQFETHMNDTEKQELVDELSADLQCYFEEHHDLPNLIQPGESDDSVESDDSGESDATGRI